jgi:hypothetical protein
MDYYLDERILERREPFRQRAFELPCRQSSLVIGLRIDNVSDRLRLREVYAPVEERAHGKLSRLGYSRATFDNDFEHAPEDDGAAVAAQLYHILAGVRVRGFENGEHDFVYGLAGRGIKDTAELRAIGKSKRYG